MPDTKQQHPPATGHRDKDAPPRLTPPFPTVAPVASQKKKRRRRRKKKQQAAASLPEAPLFEILSRVPYSSLCRIKCVSRSWLALCSDPDIRKRSPQTLSGFFFNDPMDKPGFRNLSGRGPTPVDPSHPFLRGYEGVVVEKCCGGLLLCKCWETWDHLDYDLVVCNPATEKWTVLPPMNISRWHYEDPIHFFLGFGMAVPSRFMVFVPLRGFLDDVTIYSSETGLWIKGGWEDGAVRVVTTECVFLNGFMHLMNREPFIVAVNTEGEDCWKISLPEGMETIGQS
ncbi:hypothetical protein ACQ4PT_050143 [Festuca glaucescens]